MAKSKIDDVLSMLDKIEEWAKMGLTDRQIANNLGIARSTFEKYKSISKDLMDTLKRGKKVSNYEVENALYKKATGYIVKEKVPYKLKDIYYDDNGNKCVNERIEIVDTEKEIPADVVAIKFWLVNRDRQNWKDNPSKYELDKEMLELKKKQIDEGEW